MHTYYHPNPGPVLSCHFICYIVSISALTCQCSNTVILMINIAVHLSNTSNTSATITPHPMWRTEPKDISFYRRSTDVARCPPDTTLSIANNLVVVRNVCPRKTDVLNHFCSQRAASRRQMRHILNHKPTSGVTQTIMPTAPNARLNSRYS